MDYIGYKSISGFYDRVRGLIGLTAETLSDDTMDFFENAPSSERRLLRKVGSLEEIADEKLPILESCVVYQTAIDSYSVAHRSGGIKVEQTQNLKVEYFASSENENLLDILSTKLADLIDELLDNEVSNSGDYRFELTQ